MKAITFVLLAAALGGGSLNASGYMFPPSSDEIAIKEKTLPNGGILDAYAAPIADGWVADEEIFLTFLTDLGAVTIPVTGAKWAGLTINTQDWSDGDYAFYSAQQRRKNLQRRI
ncbi:MAG: hypothetical protein LBD91_06540 [Prevotellaceae bacterium]|jgi:hypothetical protein|nr:hypothetical protein [Prevotellaceae bacterium]